MSLIMINLGSEDKNYNGLIRMLDLLLNKYTKAEKSREAEETLKNDYNVKLRYNSKGDDDMCNLSQGIYNDGVAEGAVLKAIEVVKNLLAKGFSLEEALTIADIDKETYEEYSAKENLKLKKFITFITESERSDELVFSYIKNLKENWKMIPLAPLNF